MRPFLSLHQLLKNALGVGFGPFELENDAISCDWGASINYVGRRRGGGLVKCICYDVSLCHKLAFGGGSKIGKILPA